MVLLVALLLIGAAGARYIPAASTPELYILGLLGLLGTVGVFALFAMASGIMRCPAGTMATRCSRRLSITPSTALWSPTSGQGLLRQRHLSRFDRRRRQQQCAPDRTGVHRRSRRLRGDLHPAQGRARGPGACEEVRIAGAGTTPARWLQAARAPARRYQARRAHVGLVDRRCDPRTARARKMYSRNSSTPSTISTTRRPDFSRSMPAAPSSISMPRSPTGSITISPRSAPASSSSPISSPARARRC